MTGLDSEMEKYNMHYDEIIEVKARLLQENEGGELYIHDPDREAENDAIYEVMSKYYPEVYGDELESEEERALWNDAQVKHITDLETAVKKAADMWDEETPLFDFELMITGIKEQFAYLFDLDDGYMDGDE